MSNKTQTSANGSYVQARYKLSRERTMEEAKRQEIQFLQALGRFRTGDTTYFEDLCTICGIRTSKTPSTKLLIHIDVKERHILCYKCFEKIYINLLSNLSLVKCTCLVCNSIFNKQKLLSILTKKLIQEKLLFDQIDEIDKIDKNRKDVSELINKLLNATINAQNFEITECLISKCNWSDLDITNAINNAKNQYNTKIYDYLIKYERDCRCGNNSSIISKKKKNLNDYIVQKEEYKEKHRTKLLKSKEKQVPNVCMFANL